MKKLVERNLAVASGGSETIQLPIQAVTDDFGVSGFMLELTGTINAPGVDLSEEEVDNLLTKFTYNHLEENGVVANAVPGYLLNLWKRLKSEGFSGLNTGIGSAETSFKHYYYFDFFPDTAAKIRGAFLKNTQVEVTVDLAKFAGSITDITDGKIRLFALGEEGEGIGAFESIPSTHKYVADVPTGDKLEVTDNVRAAIIMIGQRTDTGATFANITVSARRRDTGKDYILFAQMTSDQIDQSEAKLFKIQAGNYKEVKGDPLLTLTRPHGSGVTYATETQTWTICILATRDRKAVAPYSVEFHDRQSGVEIPYFMVSVDNRWVSQLEGVPA